MTKQTEALKLALEALEEIHPGNMTPMAEEAWKKAITALREALTEQPAQQETVAIIRKALEQGAMLAVHHRYSNPAAYPDQLDRLALQLAATPQPAQQQEPVAVELVGVKEAIKEGDGFWKPCTGCYETNEGYPPTGAFFSAVFKCHMGHGCSECGGLGAIWDDTDYEAMADHMMRDDAAPQPAQQEPVSDRENAIIRFALHQFMSNAYSNMNAAAQDKDSRHYTVGAVEKFAKDAKDAEALLSRLQFKAPQPAQRKPWVGLTDAEIRDWWRIENGLEDCNMAKLNDFTLAVRAVELKLREKNT